MADASSQLQTARGLVGAGRFREAAAALEVVLRDRPFDAESNYLMAGALLQCRDPARAAGHAERACAGAPGNADAHNLLGLIRIQGGQLEGSVAPLTRAIELRPGWVDPMNNLGVVLAQLGRREEAAAVFERALGAGPNDVRVLLSYGLLLRDLGRVDRSVALLRRGAGLAPGMEGAWNNLAPALNYAEDATPMEVLEAHKRLGSLIESRVAAPPAYGQAFDPDRAVHVGFLSQDLRGHSVSFFLMPLLASRDRERLRVTLYSAARQVDARSEALRSLADGWVDVSRLADEAIAQRVHADRVDVLIDLGGHTQGSRLRAMRVRPAPVQATYLGYPATTGMRSIDARIVDSITDPPGAEAWCVERLARLDPCFLCYGPPEDAPGVAMRPAGGPIVFGHFGTPTKVGPGVCAAWARVLAGVPGSRLAFKAAGGGEDAGARVVRERLVEAGVEASRIDLLPYAPTRREHLAMYARVDVGLDTFPYAGTTTTCEAMLMGVPVVTLEGTTHAARVGSSLLRCVGLGELVATSVDGYVSIAAALAGDADRRRALREGLRGRLLGSALCDGPGFARRFEALVRGLWRGACEAKRAPGSGQ